MSGWPEPVERVADFLRKAAVESRVEEFPEGTLTAEDAARAVGCDLAQIVKSLVFTADGDPVMVLASGDHQVDTAAVATALGVEKVKRADADTVRAATGYPIGGVPPVAHSSELRLLVDRHLATYDVLWAAAGTPHAVFSTTFDELVRLTGGETADVGAG